MESRKMTLANKILSPTYARRIARGLAKGLTRAQARGHAPPKKRRKRTGPTELVRRLEAALKDMKNGMSLKDAARKHGVAPETLRRYISEQTQVTREGRRLIIKDRRPRQFPVYSEGQLKAPMLRPREATKASAFMRGVDKFLNSGNRQLLQGFEGRGVTDVKRAFVPFETDPNSLYQLDAAGELSFPEIYKIVR
jgi:transposase-like protein